MFDQPRSGLSYIELLAMNSGLMKQQKILSEVSLNRNMPKIRLCVAQLMKLL